MSDNHPPNDWFPNPVESYERFTVDRDNAPKLEFDGVLLGAVEDGDEVIATRAAVYRTKGGKFITEFARYELRHVVWDANKKRPKLFDKAGVFDTMGEALDFFRPGRLTNQLLEQLGIKRTEFID